MKEINITNNIKVALVTNNICSTGGVKVFTRVISNILEERGHEVDIIGVESLLEVPEKGIEKAVGEYFNQRDKKEKYDIVLCNGEFGYVVEHPRAINIFHGNYYGYAMAVEHLVPKSLTQARLIKAELQRISSEGKYVVTRLRRGPSDRRQ